MPFSRNDENGFFYCLGNHANFLVVNIILSAIFQFSATVT